MPTRDREYDVTGLLDEYADFLMEFADGVYQGRRQLFRDEFDGYVDDTIYLPNSDKYFFWPAQDEDGWFLGFDEPCEGERDAIEMAQEQGFEYIGCGANRIVLSCPGPFDDLVVKAARSGLTEFMGNGRMDNLKDWRYTSEFENAPFVPCLHCSPGGEFTIYPKVGETFEERPPGEGVREQLARELAETVPHLTEVDATSKDANMAWWDDEPIILDGYHPRNKNRVIGLPDHVDAERVIEQVDELRRRGEKMDVDGDGGGLIEPEISSDVD